MSGHDERTTLALHGAGGRMGRAIARAALESSDLRLAVAVDRDGSSVLGRDVGELAGLGACGVVLGTSLEALAKVRVVIDFSSPAATAALARALTPGKTALVVGTTGLDADANDALDALAKTAAVLTAPNTSIGVNVLFHLAEEATRLLGPDFDAEIVEMHHKHKVDAPSGTALRLAERVRAAKTDAQFVHGRSGQVGARKQAEVGILALRGGDVIGEHTLVLAGPGERLELTHRAHDRSLFARGALRAARFVAAAKPGRYDMADAIGLRRR